MPLSWYEIRDRAVAFVREWDGESSEHAEAKSFWDAFFHVFGVSRRLIASTLPNQTMDGCNCAERSKTTLTHLTCLPTAGSPAPMPKQGGTKHLKYRGTVRQATDCTNPSFKEP